MIDESGKESIESSKSLRLESFLTHSADAIWMIDLDDRVLQINPAFEMLGNGLPIVPDFLVEEIEELHQQIKAGHSEIGYETQRLCKDGRRCTPHRSKADRE